MLNSQTFAPKDFLAIELARRCQKNPSYSLRAFAKALGISPTALSLILNGKRKVSRKASVRIADTLALDSLRRSEFLRNCHKQNLPPELSEDETDTNRPSTDALEAISQWHHYAILSLLVTKEFKPNTKWIAKRLKITVHEVKATIERLQRLGILNCSSKPWRQLGGAIRVDENESSAASRRFQRQILEKAIHSLENDSTELRNMCSITLAMNPVLVVRAREEFKKFSRALTKILESAEAPTEVYHMAFQLYPVTEGSKK